MKLIDTDNFDGDYPDEVFIGPMPNLSTEEAQVIASIINRHGGPEAPRYCRVVDNDYILQPGFEP